MSVNSYIKSSLEGEGDITGVRMRVLAIALILMVACFCCMAGNRWNIEAQMHGKTKQLSYDNNHHGKTPATAHFDVIPGNDFVKPASVQYHVNDDNSNMGNYGKPGGLRKTHG
ncbi:hypothetical protein V8G54_027711 [Vigna mungo]|uniref:Uncharacterized protein n=1 Tax=Vigna mungo TaxID=3915 RepID=A0AAQ3N359_VIGMU